MLPGDRFRVVLADDEEDIRDVLSLSLKDSGYEVFTAENGLKALELCLAHDPQILITDIRMPEMDGLKLLEIVKKKRPEIEVIVITAFGDMDPAIKALQLDASDFVTKPINDTAFHLALDRAGERFSANRKIRDYMALLEEQNAATGQELSRMIDFQKNLLECSMDGILACEQDGTVVVLNSAMERISGCSKEDLLLKKGIDGIISRDDCEALFNALHGEGHGGAGRLMLYETTLSFKEGGRLPVQVSGSVIPGGRPGFVLFIRDLREIRRLERELCDQARVLHQDKMMSLGRLAASMVHEINNPLSGILNYLLLMQRSLGQGEMDAQQRNTFSRYLDTVTDETRRCTRIVGSLLAFSRKSPEKFESVSIDQVFERCATLSRHRLELGNISLEIDIEPDLPEIEGDFNQLQQCIINLIFNAMDAMPGGGLLRLSAKDGHDGTVKIEVSDTGRGIEPGDIPQIFEPFFTTKKEGYGVGLGLSTVYGIVRRHKGTIDVRSRPGEETVFTMTLPALKA